MNAQGQTDYRNQWYEALREGCRRGFNVGLLLSAANLLEILDEIERLQAELAQCRGEKEQGTVKHGAV